ncbi:MAG: SRPBCC family protein [Bacteroidaceae bacterium]|nr:SRPBCC family protein [Candidatus Minthousia equi]MCQ2245984.1 SRPBCC family protein [Bacteroidaceae bacterium]
MAKYESNVKQIPYPLEVVYAKLSDLNNLAVVKERVSDPNFANAAQSMGNGQVSAEQIQKLQEVLQGMTFDQDSVTIHTSAVGDISLQIVEREENRTIKMETVSSPLPFTMWIQLLPVSTGGCKMRLTIKAELNFFIRKMVESKLQDGIEQVAELLARIPYGYSL